MMYFKINTDYDIRFPSFYIDIDIYYLILITSLFDSKIVYLTVKFKVSWRFSNQMSPLKISELKNLFKT